MSAAIVIPTLTRRRPFVLQAVESVLDQTARGVLPVIVEDRERLGAWVTRNAGIELALRLDLDWIGFLDDDDYLLPQHVGTLVDLANREDADVVWPWFDVEGGTDPFPDHAGKAYDPEHPHIFPITYLARTSLVYDAYELMGGFQPDPDSTGNWGIQDRPFIDTMWRLSGGRFACTTERTWVWRHHSNNTSGCVDR